MLEGRLACVSSHSLSTLGGDRLREGRCFPEGTQLVFTLYLVSKSLHFPVLSINPRLARQECGDQMQQRRVCLKPTPAWVASLPNPSTA